MAAPQNLRPPSAAAPSRRRRVRALLLGIGAGLVAVLMGPIATATPPGSWSPAATARRT